MAIQISGNTVIDNTRKFFGTGLTIGNSAELSAAINADTKDTNAFAAYIKLYTNTNYQLFLESVSVDSSGNMFVSGYVSNPTAITPYIAKINSAGTSVLWQQTISNIDKFQGSVVDGDGNLIICGYKNTPNESYIYKVSSASGAIIWQYKINNTFTGTGANHTTIAVDESNNYYILGYTFFSSSWRSYICKISTAGSLLAQRRIDEFCTQISYKNSSVYVTSSGTSKVFKFDTSLTKVWERTISTANTAVYSAVGDSLGNVYVGYTDFSTNRDSLLKLDSTGTKVWDKQFIPFEIVNYPDNRVNYLQAPNGIMMAIDSNNDIYVTSGFTNAPIYGVITKINSSGSIVYSSSMSVSGGNAWFSYGTSSGNAIQVDSNYAYLAIPTNLSENYYVGSLVRFSKNEQPEGVFNFINFERTGWTTVVDSAVPITTGTTTINTTTEVSLAVSAHTSSAVSTSAWPIEFANKSNKGIVVGTVDTKLLNATGIDSTYITLGYNKTPLKAQGCGSFFVGVDTPEIRESTHSSNNIGIGFRVLNGMCTDAVYNLALGYQALTLSTTGNENIAIGPNALYANRFGSNNIAIGSQSGYSNTTSCHNTFLGCRTGYSNTTGSHNFFTGLCAGFCHTTGSCNFFAGLCAGNRTTTGINNVFIGSCAGVCNIHGRYNIFIGCDAGKFVTTGYYNTFIGDGAGYGSNTGNSGYHNIALGYFAGGTRLTTGSCNVFIGPSSGQYITSGSNNIFIGCSSGRCNSSGGDNIYFGRSSGPQFVPSTANHNFSAGFCSGYSLTTGNCNVFIGPSAGAENTWGCGNFFVGCSAGRGNASGYDNIHFGRFSGPQTSGGTGNSNFTAGACAGFSITNAYNNTFIGFRAGACTTTGHNNVYIGQYAGLSGCTLRHNVYIGDRAGCSSLGSYNTYIGQYTGMSSGAATGNLNVMIGHSAGRCNSTGARNVFLGTSAGRFNTTGDCSVFAGDCAGYNNNTGSQNIFFGSAAGFCNTSASYSVFAGQCAGFFNNGFWNHFIGHNAGTCNTTGASNIAIGRCAGYSMRNGSYNIFLGFSAGYGQNVGGSGNVAVGTNAAISVTTGVYNTFLSGGAGYCVTTGGYNVFLGNNSGFRSTVAARNIYIGCNAGCTNTTGCFNIIIGTDAGRCSTTGCNNIFIGYNSGLGAAGTPNGLAQISTEANRIIMGNASHTCAQIQVAWTAVSDIRDKCVWGQVPHGRDFLRNVNPIKYSFKDRETNEIADETVRYGFSAQEIMSLEGDEKVISNYMDGEKKLGMTYDYIIPVLVNAIKELDAENKSIIARLDALENA